VALPTEVSAHEIRSVFSRRYGQFLPDPGREVESSACPVMEVERGSDMRSLARLNETKMSRRARSLETPTLSKNCVSQETPTDRTTLPTTLYRPTPHDHHRQRVWHITAHSTGCLSAPHLRWPARSSQRLCPPNARHRSGTHPILRSPALFLSQSFRSGTPQSSLPGGFRHLRGVTLRYERD
jgi:hypothetical protein